MEEERIVWPRVLDEPVHRPQDVLLRRLAHRVLLVVCEDDHVFPLIAVVLDKVPRHVPDVVDASPELTALAKVVDAYEEGFTATRTLGVLESVTLRSALAEMLGGGRGGRGGMMVSLGVSVRVRRRRTCGQLGWLFVISFFGTRISLPL